MIDALTARLGELAALNQTTHCGALARDLGLTGAGTIARLTDALETLMEQDAAQGRPFRAAMINARGTDLPAPGFFDKAAALGFDPADRIAFVASQRRELHLSINIHSLPFPDKSP